MRKNVYGRKFSRDTNERKALFRNLISSLIIFEKIKTTEPKAKAIKGDVDKLITKAKKNSDLAKRILAGVLGSTALEKLINEIAPRFKNRQGGYTRIIRVGRRFGDNAMEVIMEFTEKPAALATIPSPVAKAEKKVKKQKSKSTVKKVAPKTKTRTRTSKKTK